MCRYTKIMAAVLLIVALLGLTGCSEKEDKSDFLPEAQNDKQLAILPEDWDFLDNWQSSENVPALLLTYGDTSVEPVQFGYNWSYYTDVKKSVISSVIACAMHPLEAAESLPKLDRAAVGADGISLVWQTEPTAFKITAYAYDEWQQRKCGNTLTEEITHTPVFFRERTNFELLDDEHSYVYVIDAEWDSEDAPALGGNSQWAFYVE